MREQPEDALRWQSHGAVKLKREAAPVAVLAIEQVLLCQAPQPEHVVHDLPPAQHCTAPALHLGFRKYLCNHHECHQM